MTETGDGDRVSNEPGLGVTSGVEAVFVEVDYCVELLTRDKIVRVRVQELQFLT